MRKLAKVAGIIFLLLAICYSGFAQTASVDNMPRFGMHTGTGINGNIGSNLNHGSPGDNIYNPNTFRIVQGVLFQGMAVPSGNAVGKQIDIAYNPARNDGLRLMLTIGGSLVTAELYDWEMIPIARFVDSGYTACMTLSDYARTDDEERLEKIHKDITWINFHPAFGNTLIGLNLFFADAMFVNLDLMQYADKVLDTYIAGYHMPRLNNWNISEIEDLLVLGLLFEGWQSYIYTDYGREISYSIVSNRIKFDGFPSYHFVGLSPDNRSVTVAEGLNELFDEIHSDIYNINPTVYRTAERTAQWAAFFRMVQRDYPQVWQRFMEQIDGIEVPVVETPRYWLAGTEWE